MRKKEEDKRDRNEKIQTTLLLAIRIISMLLTLVVIISCTLLL